MNHLPSYLTNHPFFKTYQGEMKPYVLDYKKKIDNFSSFSPKEKTEIVIALLNDNGNFLDLLRHEGFWCAKEEKDFIFKNLPYPEENQIPEEEIEEFLQQLISVENTLNKHRYMGYSKCRCCGINNGTGTYFTDVFAWPEGYKHYIKEHKVMPTAGFVLHIRGLIT